MADKYWKVPGLSQDVSLSQKSNQWLDFSFYGDVSDDGDYQLCVHLYGHLLLSLFPWGHVLLLVILPTCRFHCCLLSLINLFTPCILIVSYISISYLSIRVWPIISFNVDISISLNSCFIFDVSAIALEACAKICYNMHLYIFTLFSIRMFWFFSECIP